MKKHKKYIGIASLLVVVLIIFAVTSAPTAIQAMSTPRSLPIYSVEAVVIIKGVHSVK